MKRSVWLAAFVVVLVPALAHAQMGGMMGGGMRRGQMGGGGAGMGGMGGGAGMMGGMGGGMMGGGMMGGMGGMGGGMASAVQEARRSVRVELEGGKTLEGHVELGPVRIHGDLGSYAILPQKLASIRFLKGGHAGQAKEDEAEGDGGEGPGEIHLKVVTTTGEELVGTLQAPPVFRIELGYGSLVPQTQKLRTITFTDGQGHGAPAAKGEKAEKATATPHQPAGPATTKHPSSTTSPHYTRFGSSVFAVSPNGDRLTYVDLQTRKKRSIELSGTKESPIRVTPMGGNGCIAFNFEGEKISRIAVLEDGDFHTQEVRPPAKGRATPIVGQWIVVYAVGRHLYGYSALAHRWDTAELPEGVIGVPTISAAEASLEGAGHIFTFSAETGKWEHIDVRAILDVAGAERKR